MPCRSPVPILKALGRFAQNLQLALDYIKSQGHDIYTIIMQQRQGLLNDMAFLRSSEALNEEVANGHFETSV